MAQKFSEFLKREVNEMSEEDGSVDKNRYRHILHIIDKDGFDYAFTSYDDYREIKDKEFHSLRNQFIGTERNYSKTNFSNNQNERYNNNLSDIKKYYDARAKLEMYIVKQLIS